MANNVNVVNRGFEYVCQWMSGTATTTNWTYPTYVGWGGANGYNTIATALPASGPSTIITTGQWSDVGPYQEFSETRVAGTATVTGNTVAAGSVTTQIVATITAGSGESVGESFLAFTATKPSAYTISGNQTSTSAVALTMTTSGATAGGYYQMNNEVIEVTGTVGSVLTITRAQNGSSAGTAKTGDIITNGNPPGYGIANPNHGDLFAHAGFIALALNSGDSIAFTWQINVTS
jgi:methionine-rich copper-binding protein CopC